MVGAELDDSQGQGFFAKLQGVGIPARDLDTASGRMRDWRERYEP